MMCVAVLPLALAGCDEGRSSSPTAPTPAATPSVTPGASFAVLQLSDLSARVRTLRSGKPGFTVEMMFALAETGRGREATLASLVVEPGETVGPECWPQPIRIAAGTVVSADALARAFGHCGPLAFVSSLPTDLSLVIAYGDVGGHSGRIGVRFRVDADGRLSDIESLRF